MHFIFNGVVRLHSFSLNFSLLTLLLFHLFLFRENVVLFSFYGQIALSPLKDGVPSYRPHEWPCAYPLDYFPTALQSVCSLSLTSPFLCISAPSSEDRTAVGRG